MAGGLLEQRREDREEASVPTAGMADIAFLLLIFFLVTTTINVDTGIGMTLPPPLEDEEPPPVKERNLMNVLVNARGEVLIDDEITTVDKVRQQVKNHITNYGDDPNLSASPGDAVISIKTDAETPYSIYVDTLDEVWMAYREIWDQIARTTQTPSGEQVLDQTYSSYREYASNLPPGQDVDDTIREAFPANISIAEPDVEN